VRTRRSGGGRPASHAGADRHAAVVAVTAIERLRTTIHSMTPGPARRCGARATAAGHPAARPAVMTARGLEKVYRMGDVDVFALRGVDFELRQGEFVVLLGPSGSGKSTLLNIIGGLDAPTRGEVTYREHDLTTRNDIALTRYRREHVGFVFQAYNLIPSLTALENVALVAEIAERPSSRWPRARCRARLPAPGLTRGPLVARRAAGRAHRRGPADRPGENSDRARPRRHAPIAGITSRMDDVALAHSDLAFRIEGDHQPPDRHRGHVDRASSRSAICPRSRSSQTCSPGMRRRCAAASRC